MELLLTYISGFHNKQGSYIQVWMTTFLPEHFSLSFMTPEHHWNCFAVVTKAEVQAVLRFTAVAEKDSEPFYLLQLKKFINRC